MAQPEQKMNGNQREYHNELADQIAKEIIEQGEISHGFRSMLDANPALSTLVRKKIDEERKLLIESQ